MKLSFFLEERRAVYCIAKEMILADNKVDDKEMMVLLEGFTLLGSTLEELQQIEANNTEMNPAEAIKTMAGFGADKKKHVCAMLMALMVVDGDVDESENKLLCFVSSLCGFPNISVSEALNYISKL